MVRLYIHTCLIGTEVCANTPPSLSACVISYSSPCRVRSLDLRSKATPGSHPFKPAFERKVYICTTRGGAWKRCVQEKRKKNRVYVVYTSPANFIVLHRRVARNGLLPTHHIKNGQDEKNERLRSTYALLWFKFRLTTWHHTRSE